MWSKWQFFDFFSKMALAILMKLAQNVELINSEHLAKTACQIFIRSRDIHPQSSHFGQKCQKWCLKKAPYIENRKCYRKSDLIFRIYDKFSFLYVSSDFCLLVVFMVKKWLEDGQFSCTFLSGFRLISRQRLDRFAWNLVRSEIKWLQRRCKRPDVKILSQSGDIKPQIAKNRPKIDRNLWMTQKIFAKNFFGWKASKGPIRSPSLLFLIIILYY